MAHSHYNCPICNNQIQDRSLEQCDRCGWVLAVEKSSLDPRHYDMLLDWGSRSYEKISELEGRGKYRQDKLNQRLDSQRDDIEHLQQQIKTLCTQIPAIKSILESPVNTKPEDNLVRDSTNSNIVMECRQIANEPIGYSDKEDLNSPIAIEAKIEEIPSINRIDTQSDRIQSSSIYQSISSEYYHNTNNFASRYNVITVSVTKDSIERNRGNDDKTVIFEETTRGNYWLFTIDDLSYLVPVADKYINQHSYTTTTLSFDCHSYTPDYQKIQLQRPAIVSIDPYTNLRMWRLQEQGEIFFL
jgi:hypothetical protein